MSATKKLAAPEELQYPPLVLDPPMCITFIESLDQVDELIEWLDEHPTFGWDIETTPLKDFYYRRARTMQFGDRDRQFLIDLLGIVGGDSTILRDCQGHYGKHLDPRLRKLVERLSPYLCERNYLKVGVNLGFEYMSHYWLFGLRTQRFFDCMMVEKCIWAGAHSLKDYGFFSMHSMVGRYFHREVEKALQKSFTLTEPLTDDQIVYACLDVRLPLTIKKAQDYIIHGNSRQSIPRWVNAPSYVCGDSLESIAKIENDAIGAFQDMSVHGDCIDIPRWTKKIENRKKDLVGALEALDAAFIPYVGHKGGVAYTEKQILDAEFAWKSIKLPKASGKIADDETGKQVPTYSDEDQLIVDQREALKKAHGEMKKACTSRKHLASSCQGEALINYNSPKQIKDVFQQVEGLRKLKTTDADTLERYEKYPICAALSTYRKISKEISTYGMTWVTEWKDEVPSKENAEEGWVNPNDHRLHPQYNQYDAETGRSTSSGPNGQNLPHDPETRACFIAGPIDDEIKDLRNSKCCGKRALAVPTAKGTYQCTKCKKTCNADGVEPETYVLLTIDMAGAELRIIAEMANEKIWIDAFNKGQDVHSICCELVDPEKWASLECVAGETIVKNGKTITLPPCAYYALATERIAFPNGCAIEVGEMLKAKCECPGHNSRRNDFKPVNFGIAYGLGPRALSGQIKKDEAECKAILKSHRAALPVLWAYIDASGKRAVQRMKSFDLFGRRELFKEPTYEDALRFVAEHKDDDEPPTVKSALKALYSMIERAGKNMPIQSANATIAKLALGSGLDKHGKPFLWHIFPKYKAKLIKFVHDEAVVRCYKSNADEVSLRTADAIRRAAAEKLRKVTMDSEAHIEVYWCKG